MKDDQMVEEVSIEEFRSTGLPMYINQILHIFGYAIGFKIDDETKEIKMVPMRTKFRGFSSDCINRNYEKLAAYLRDNSTELYNEAEYNKRDDKTKRLKAIMEEALKDNRGLETVKEGVEFSPLIKKILNICD